VSGMMRSPDINAEGVVHALQLAGDTLRLTTATPDQLNAAAAFLGKALVRFEEGSSRDARRFDVVQRLEAAGKAIGAELTRRAFE
jgi:hypothetical protein